MNVVSTSNILFDLFVYFVDFSTVINNLLRDFDKCNLIATANYFNHLKYKFSFTNPINILKIKNLQYYDNFTNILIGDYYMYLLVDFGSLLCSC